MKSIAYFHRILLLSYIAMFSSCVPICTSKKIQKNFEHREKIDALIVPGRPYTDSKKGNYIFKARLYWAIALYKRGIVKNIIFSGASVHTNYVEGTVMKLFAQTLLTDSQHIFSDTLAEHGTENVFYSLMMAREMGFEKVAVATDIFQIRYVRRYLSFRKMDLAVLPVNFSEVKPMRKKLPEIDTQKASAGLNWKSLNERKTKTELKYERRGGAFAEKMDSELLAYTKK